MPRSVKISTISRWARPPSGARSRSFMTTRLGAGFAFSALYSGSQQTGWRRVDSYAGGALTLSTAFTISGAAIDPDTYATNARPIAFLMGLLNVRLGYWAKHPRLGHERNPLLPWWWIFLFREMLGIRLDARRRHIHLSDGGGFENLGLYELVRRRVKTIVVCDAGAAVTNASTQECEQRLPRSRHPGPVVARRAQLDRRGSMQ